MQIINVLILCLLTFTNCKKDKVKEQPLTGEARLTEQLTQIFKDADFPGFTIGIIKEGNIAYQNNFGFQNIENQQPYTNQTIQPIGSISKTFIGAATARAIELGLFTLETPINDILVTPIINPNQPDVVIQVKHLVNHTSGLMDNDEVYLASYYILPNQDLSSQGAQLMQSFGVTQHAPKSLKDFIHAYYYPNGSYYNTHNFSKNMPGTEETYSNVASSLMAYLIEKASNMPYQAFLKTNILEPLQMSNTAFDYSLPNANYATLYFDQNTPLPLYNLESFPDGALKTSHEDIMKYMADMLAGVRGQAATFSPSFYEILFTKTSDNFSLFWSAANGEKAFVHNGSDPGLTTDLQISGSLNMGFFILTNYDTSTDEHEEHFNETYLKIAKEILAFLEL